MNKWNQMTRMLTCRIMRTHLIPGQATPTVTKCWPHRLKSRQLSPKRRPLGRQAWPWNRLSNPAIRIISRQPRAIVMGQHRVATLRILVRLMRDIRGDVFRGTTELGENDFWMHVAFRLDGRGGENTQDKIWLAAGLDYIRIGALPNDAQCIKDALREVWIDAGTILRTAQHPYGYYPGCANESYFNSDLCPRWSKAMMTQNNAMSNILERAIIALLAPSHFFLFPSNSLSTNGVSTLPIIKLLRLISLPENLHPDIVHPRCSSILVPAASLHHFSQGSSCTKSLGAVSLSASFVSHA
jgi:hypothetical protein